MESLHLRNPHSVLAALRTRPQDVLSLNLSARGADSGPWEPVRQLAESKNVRILSGAEIPQKRPQKGRPQRGPQPEPGRSGMTGAQVRPREPRALEEVLSNSSATESGLWLALDNLQDPQNVGAIFRLAGFFGVRGILLTQERSAPLTSTVYDVASGGLETVPFTTQVNLKRALDAAKEAGLWVLGTSEHAADDYRALQSDRKWLLVLGNEEKGMRRLTEESCDLICAIKPRGEVSSLNVSVAAGVLVSHLAGS